MVGTLIARARRLMTGTRASTWRAWLARARNVVTIVLLASAYALRERRSWQRWQRRPGRKLQLPRPTPATTARWIGRPPTDAGGSTAGRSIGG
jgi:hypothetical protein